MECLASSGPGIVLVSNGETVVADAVHNALKLNPGKTLLEWGSLRNGWQCLVAEDRERLKSVLDVPAMANLRSFFG